MDSFPPEYHKVSPPHNIVLSSLRKAIPTIYIFTESKIFVAISASVGKHHPGFQEKYEFYQSSYWLPYPDVE